MGARACTPLAARSGSRVLSTRHRSTCLRRASLVFVSLPPLAQLALVHPQTQETPQQPKRLTWERKESPEEFKEPPERGPCARALICGFVCTRCSLARSPRPKEPNHGAVLGHESIQCATLRVALRWRQCCWWRAACMHSDGRHCALWWPASLRCPAARRCGHQS